MFGCRPLKTSAVVALAWLLLLASTPAATAAVNDQPLPDSVLVIHDSVLRDSRPQIDAAFAGVDTDYLGWVGLRVEVAANLLKDNPRLIADKVIVELGYNFVARPKRKLFRNDIDALMSQLADVEQVVWMTATEFEPRMLIVNHELRLAAHRWPNLQIAEWHKVTAADSSLSFDDGYHLNPSGSRVFAHFARDHLTDRSLWNKLPSGRFRIAEVARGHKITGWAFDPELGQPARVRLLVDGKVVKRVNAKIRRDGLAGRIGANHGVGYQTRIQLTPGNHTVCIEVNNFDGLRPVQLHCRPVVAR